MLVLMRRVGETILIGDNISITVADIKGNQCKLALVAPKNIPINRLEVHQRIQMEKEINDFDEIEEHDNRGNK